MACTVCACSSTEAGLPWNSKNRVGASASVVLLNRLMAFSDSASSSSMRATGTPSWMVWITVCTAESMSGKVHTAAEMASGIG